MIKEPPYPDDPYDSPDVVPDSEPGTNHETRNFLALACHQILVRIGWIFKTESIIMPAFLDAIGGNSVMRGLLPVLNRFGFSIPPVLFARQLKQMPRKRSAVAGFSVGMAITMLALAWMWNTGWGREGSTAARWWPWLFLAMYGVFFVVTGLNQLSMHTAQGKLVRPSLRGRLMTTSILVGAPIAIGLAYLLLPVWLATVPPRFDLVFGSAGLAFLVAAISTLLLAEPRDDHFEASTPALEKFAAAWKTIRGDRNFRRLAAVASLFGVVMMLFPHYEALGREKLDQDVSDLMVWVVTQNLGTMVFSLFAGPLADRFGNRLALQFTLLGSIMTPLLAVVLSLLGPERGGSLFWIIFPTIGLTPVNIRLLTNYALEISPVEDHARYVSTLGLCVAVPVMLGVPLVGWLVGAIGFLPVMIGGTVLTALAGLLSFGLVEPRHAPAEGSR